MSYEPTDFTLVEYIGHSLMGYSVKEVGRMYIGRFNALYDAYKTFHDFDMKHGLYSQVDKVIRQGDDWLPD